MSIAVTKGKISTTGKNLTSGSEDLLTASVFGVLRYLPAELLLFPILKHAKNLNDDLYKPDTSVQDSEIDFEFWPGLNTSEPDVVIKTGMKELIFIESKFNSGKSGSYNTEREGKKSTAKYDQLYREFKDLVDYSDGNNNSIIKTLIYLTAHRTMPKDDFISSYKAVKESELSSEIFKKNTYWLSWFDVWKVCKDFKSEDENPFYMLMVRDLIEFLEKLELKHFTGFSCEREIEPINKPIFYEANN